MKEKIINFKLYWFVHFPYIAMELTDTEIADYIRQERWTVRACMRAVDAVLSKGQAEVQE